MPEKAILLHIIPRIARSHVMYCFSSSWKCYVVLYKKDFISHFSAGGGAVIKSQRMDWVAHFTQH